jgi:DNA polymerase-3 subunit alpha
MSYVVLEDDSGSMELIVFQKTLDACGAYIRENEIVIAKGRISARDEKEPQLMCDSIRPISDLSGGQDAAAAQTERKLYVKLPSCEDPGLRHLELVLKMFPGSDKMVIWCEKERKKLAARCLFHEVLLDELRECFGEENVVLK